MIKIKNVPIQKGYYRNISGGDKREINPKKKIDTILIYLLKNEKSIDSLKDTNPDKMYMKQLSKDKSLKFPVAFFVFVKNNNIEYTLWYNEIDKNMFTDNRLYNDFQIIKQYYKLKNKKISSNLALKLDRITYAYFYIFIELQKNLETNLNLKNFEIDIKNIQLFISATRV